MEGRVMEAGRLLLGEKEEKEAVVAAAEEREEEGERADVGDVGDKGDEADSTRSAVDRLPVPVDMESDAEFADPLLRPILSRRLCRRLL